MKGTEMISEIQESSSLYTLMRKLIAKNHHHLGGAHIVLYKVDKFKTKGEYVIFAKADKANTKMKASMNADFTITLFGAWDELSESQQEACMDHELSHCGVQYEAEKENGKVIKDKWGRIKITNKMKEDENGDPKWRLIPHDLEEFRDIVRRHGIWDDSIQAFKAALDSVKINGEEDKSENNGQ